MASSPGPTVTLVNSHLLKDFMDKLLTHQISIFGEQMLRVNGEALARNSKLFYLKFKQAYRNQSATTEGSEQPVVQVERSDVCCLAGLEILIYFCHFQTLRSHELAELKEALIASLQFRCPTLRLYVGAHIRSVLSLHSAISLYQHLHMLSGTEAADSLHCFVLKHFMHLSARTEFFDLSANALVMCLKEDRLNVWNEDQLLARVIEWCSKKKENLLNKLRVLCCVRHHLLTDAGLKKLRTCSLYKQYKCVQLSPMYKAFSFDRSHSLRLSHEAPLLIGGRIESDDEFDIREEYGMINLRLFDTRSKRWHQLPPEFWLPEPRAAFGCVMLHSAVLFVIGGRLFTNEICITATCAFFDFRVTNPNKRWQEAAVMHEARQRLSCCSVTLDNCQETIVAIGGDIGGSCSATVELYEYWPVNRWRLLSPLSVGRCDAAAVSVGCGQVAVCGGFLDSGRRLRCDYVELLDIRSNQWTALHHMRYRRGCPIAICQPAQCSADQQQNRPDLIVLGGNSSAAAERFCWRQQTWSSYPLQCRPARAAASNPAAAPPLAAAAAAHNQGAPNFIMDGEVGRWMESSDDEDDNQNFPILQEQAGQPNENRGEPLQFSACCGCIVDARLFIVAANLSHSAAVPVSELTNQKSASMLPAEAWIELLPEQLEDFGLCTLKGVDELEFLYYSEESFNQGPSLYSELSSIN